MIDSNDPMRAFKRKYNALLERHKNAEIYFDGGASEEEKERFYSEFKKLLDEINEQAMRMIRRGVKKGDWILKGF